MQFLTLFGVRQHFKLHSHSLSHFFQQKLSYSAAVFASTKEHLEIANTADD